MWHDLMTNDCGDGAVCVQRERRWLSNIALSRNICPLAVVVLGRLILLVFCGSRRQFVRQPNAAFKRASRVPLPVRAALRWQHVAGQWFGNMACNSCAQLRAMHDDDATTHDALTPIAT